jgi:hypothetical protein
MTNMERAAMLGKLTEKREEVKRLRLRIDGESRAIRIGLNTALTPVEDLEIPTLKTQMDELAIIWGKLQGLLFDISRLEKELG